ncbi:MAG: hypothetical protein DRH30_07880 [Deltaproteobacteria bacterium]|nr:MAG: hypothetical protein DRH30_07880 [Deltaproteobacteria bacterium]
MKKSNDAWAEPKRVNDGVQKVEGLPEVLLSIGGPWHAYVGYVYGETKKGNRSKRKASMLENGATGKRIRCDPPGNIAHLRRVADQLNGWECAREFPPGYHLET